jgi:hypothetical protein
VIEGVCKGDEFTAFDLPEFATQDFRTLNYGTRFSGLRHLGFPVSRHLKIAQIAVELGSKAELLERLRTGGKKAFVLRKANAAHRTGACGAEYSLLKCRFGDFTAAESSRASP